ncbi:MAG: FAD-dependent oxidoreductase, partial [Gemmatimonadota bacterium]
MGDVIVRDPAEAAASAHDLIVVGGGVYGTMLTLEAARRGLRPLLVERSDFGSQTTENSLRIVHGGLRYLQTMDLRRFRESVRERAWLLETFPGHVRPLECFMPLYGEGLRRRWVFAVALALNEGLARLGGGRNELPPGRTLGPEEAGRVLGIVPGGGLTGAAVWYDAVMEDSERVVIEALHAACDHGARALNYV